MDTNTNTRKALLSSTSGTHTAKPKPILCALSGVTYHADHMPASLRLTAREAYHPMFAASYTQLLQLTEDWAHGELTITQEYLLYLALFRSTGLVEFRTPALQTPLTASVVTTNMPALVRTVAMVHKMTAELERNKFALPRYVVTTDTRTLENTQYWIANWDQCYVDYCDAYRSRTKQEQIVLLETNLDRIIRDQTKDIGNYAGQLAEWAAKAGDFASIDCTVADGQFNDRPILLSDYWKRIIRQCAKRTDVYSLHDGDLDELIEHCACTIGANGSVLAHRLMQVLRDVQRTKNNFFQFGDIDVGERGTIYKILDPEGDIEDANKVVLIDTAPTKNPVESEYPSKLAYLRARTKYQMAQRHAESDALRKEATLSAVLVGSLTAQLESAGTDFVASAPPAPAVGNTSAVGNTKLGDI